MQGDNRVEQYMLPISEAIERHITDRNARTEIYNRAYEAVWKAIKDNVKQ